MSERFTRPPAGTPEYYEELNEDYERRGTYNSNSARAVVNDKSKGFIVAVLVAVNILATLMMYAKWRDAEMEKRMVEYYILELDGKLMAAGIIKPPESWSARKQKEK